MRGGPTPSPLWGEGGGEGQLALDRSLSFEVRLTLLSSAGRDVRPVAHLLFFASPKKRRQKKGDPTGRVPSLRCGQPAMLAPGAVLRNSLRSLRSLRSDNRSKSEHEAWACCAAHARPSRCASRHGQRGVQSRGRAQRWPASKPLWLRLRRGVCGVARAPQDARASWTDSPRLSERSAPARSEFCGAPRKRRDAGLPRSEAQGSQTWGRFSLVPFFGETKKGTAPPGAYPGRQRIQRRWPLTPTLSPKGRGSEVGEGA